MKPHHVDYPFLTIVLLLTGAGFIIFSSAALGLLARDGASFSSVATSQVLFGIIGGCIAMTVISKLDYRLFRKFAIHLYVLAFILTLLTFVPGIGLELKGAHRWIEIGGFSFQPAEALKFATIVLLASFFATHFRKIQTVKLGLVPLLGIIGISAIPMVLQPDNDGVMILTIACVSVFFAAGGRFMHLLGLGGAFVAVAAIIVFTRPYVMDRVITFIDPSRDPQGAGYQLQQSLIAVGSGELFGRGFGQSIQKFSHLPEPVGDSIFAVAGEEFGFAGSLFLVLAFLAFITAGLRIAARAEDRFGGLVVVGLVILIGSQSFVNIASLIGLFPLSGMPLVFISHGGTALLIALAEAGVILSVSRRMQSA